MSRKQHRTRFLLPVWNCQVLFILNLCYFVVWSQEREGEKQCDVKDNHCIGGKCKTDSACHGPYFGYHCLYYNTCGKKAAEIQRVEGLEIITVIFPLAIVYRVHMTTLNDSDLSDVVFSFKRTPTDKETACDGLMEHKSSNRFVYYCSQLLEASLLLIRNVKKNLVQTIAVNDATKDIQRSPDTDITSVHFPLSRVRLVQITLTNSPILQDLPIIILKKTPQDKAATCNGFAVQTSQKYIEYHCRQLLEASILIITQMKASLVETVAISEGRNILPRQSYLQLPINSSAPQHQSVSCISGENIDRQNESVTIFMEPVMINSLIYLDKNEEEIKVTNVELSTYDVECNVTWTHRTKGTESKVFNDKESIPVKYFTLDDDETPRQSTCELLVLGDCPLGRYGVYCNFTCSERCLHRMCTVEGFCLRCRDDSSIGLQCCSKYCKDDICDADGTCIRGCKSEREGIDCSKVKMDTFSCMCPTGHCDANGQCDEGERCIKGYFGHSCQYLDGTTEERLSQNEVLLDNDDKTCMNISKENLLIRTHPLRIRFVRLVYEGNLNFGDIEFLFINENNIVDSCLGKPVAIAENILEHHCHRIFDIIGVIINSSNVARLCDVYVSMGRSIFFEGSISTPGKVESEWGFLKNGKCAVKAVNNEGVYIKIEHDSPVAIDRFHFLDVTDSRMAQKKVLIIHAIFAKATNIVMKCTNPTNITDMFEAEHCIPVGEEVSFFTDERYAENKECTLEAYGACDEGKFGFQCEYDCSDACQNRKCTLEGNCVGCSNTTFTGIRCKEPIPKECPLGKYGNECHYGCSSGCKRCTQLGGVCVECQDRNKPRPPCSVTTEESPRKNCPAGRYGAQCQLQCNTKCKDRKCTYAGHCIACNNELYYGVQCEKKRTVNSCPEGKYGNNCQKSCSGSCKKCTVTGLCDGCRFHNYHGSNCSILIRACSPYCANDGSCYADLACVFGCKPGFHGPQCTHLGLASEFNSQETWTCHCHNFECDHPFDRCPQFSMCFEGWFGYSCDYRDLAIWSNATSPLLIDNNNQTCFLAPNNTVTAQWRNPVFFSWLWMTFEDSAKVSNFSMIISEDNVTSYLNMSVLDVTALKSNLIEVYYSSPVWLTSMIVSWKGVGQVCTLSVSGDQDLALGLPTVSYPKSKQLLKNQIMLLTDGDVGGAKCVSGEYMKTLKIEFSFPEPVFISRIVIFPDHRMEDDDTVVIEMWDSASYLGNITSQKLKQQNYTSISFVFADDITFIDVSLVEGKRNICEIQIFGDCMPPRHGFFCKDECSMTCKGDACFYDGTCITCVRGRQGPYCMEYLEQVTPESQNSDESLINRNGMQVRKGLFLVNIGMLIITNIRLFI